MDRVTISECLVQMRKWMDAQRRRARTRLSASLHRTAPKASRTRSLAPSGERETRRRGCTCSVTSHLAVAGGWTLTAGPRRRPRAINAHMIEQLVRERASLRSQVSRHAVLAAERTMAGLRFFLRGDLTRRRQGPSVKPLARSREPLLPIIMASPR